MDARYFWFLLAISALRVSIPGWMTADMTYLYLYDLSWPFHWHCLYSFYHSIYVSVIISILSLYCLYSISTLSLSFCFSPESTAWKATVQSQPRIPRRPTSLPLHYSQSGIILLSMVLLHATLFSLLSTFCYSTATLYVLWSTDGWMECCNVIYYCSILCT